MALEVALKAGSEIIQALNQQDLVMMIIVVLRQEIIVDQKEDMEVLDQTMGAQDLEEEIMEVIAAKAKIMVVLVVLE